MASPTVLAPDALTDPEPWDHLSRHKARKSSLLAASLAIQAACPRDPGHATTPASGCKHCRRKIVDAISARYLSAPETEWYADRRTFLQHLAELFPAVKRGEVDASGIEDRVMDEKRRWFRESVRRIAGTAGAAGMSAEKEELARLLDDRKIKFEDFCERVREVVSRVLKTGVPEGALEKLMGAGNDAKARAEVYKEVFFFPFGEKAEVGESTRKCVEMVEQGVSMTKIAAKMLEHRKQALADRAELERLQNRIEYLKKAKATWLAQRKRREGAEEKPKAQPPCFSCGNVPDEADPLSCAVCHVAVAREIMEQTVVYCSEKCQEAAHDRHVEEAHSCAAGERCTTLYQPEDDATGTTDDEGEVYICKQCLEQHKAVAVFCVLACADAGFKRHHEEVHHGAGSWQPVSQHLVTLEQALRDMQEKEVINELKFVPKVAPRVQSVKPQSAKHEDAHMDVDKVEEHPSKAGTHTAARSAEHMNMDVANEGPLDNARGSAARVAQPIRHDDERPAPDKMQGVEMQSGSEPAPNHNPDTEMMDAVDATDFAGRPQAAGSEPAPAQQPPSAHSPQHRSQAATTSPPQAGPARLGLSVPFTQTPPFRPPSPLRTSDQSSPSKGSGRADSSDLYNPSNPSEAIPLASPRAAAAMAEPSTTIASPDRVTSIEPMPSLGRSLEIEIAKIPSGSEARSPDENHNKTESELASERFRDVEAMDRIADGKMETIGETAGWMGLRGRGRDGGGEADGSEMENMMTGGGETGRTQAGGKSGLEKLLSDREIERDQQARGREEGPRMGEIPRDEIPRDEIHPHEDVGERREQEQQRRGDGKTTTTTEPPPPPTKTHDTEQKQQHPDTGSYHSRRDEAAYASNLAQRAGHINPCPTTTTTAENPARRAEKEAGKVPNTLPSVEASNGKEEQKSQDSREEGEISDDSGRKRKASMEPGEVEEEEEHEEKGGGRDVKRARSVEGEGAVRRRD
ncbi:hypothetical protein NKR19_g9312 [Coniochaeta hoffmannii]|uniref:MYND-type zinc finger protein samB n=1 Tax=Coniochaeta hoffmannii TaxID=91930 RepID=A0AA38VHH8_9PEZI|nr:hypothetical protein NKR19_g9312 [Coniochaeta hoffmannii]